jgi:hypothetical protein
MIDSLQEYLQENKKNKPFRISRQFVEAQSRTKNLVLCGGWHSAVLDG